MCGIFHICAKPGIYVRAVDFSTRFDTYTASLANDMRDNFAFMLEILLICSNTEEICSESCFYARIVEFPLN